MTGTTEGFDAQACVIGAGPAGLAMGKALADRGIDFDWFEKGSMVGGLWRIDNDNGEVAAYRTLHLNSSRTRTEYPSYPMPKDWPDYPSHELMATYFQGFAEANGLVERITFHAPVTRVEPLPGPGDPGANGWAVTNALTGTRRYRHVLVANGHHSRPKLASFPGEFVGKVFHSHEYDDPAVFTDRDVVVVGVGNSGLDIACDASRVARSVHLVTRHGVHVIPKYAFGRPVDTLSGSLTAFLPFVVERLAYEAILLASIGRPQDHGLPKPDHRLLGAHPSVSAELYDRIGHGEIVVKRGIESLEGDHIRFADGSTAPADMLVLATGYEVSLPFLDPDVFDPTGNRMALYQRVVAPDRPGLLFVGFIQAVGSGIALTEYQADWIGDVIAGVADLPEPAEMRDWIAQDQGAMRRRYVKSERHTMQVDYWRYIRALKIERTRRAHPSPKQRLASVLAGLR